MTRETRVLRRGLPFAALLVIGITVRAGADCIDGAVHSCTVGGQTGTTVCEGGEWQPCEGPNGPIPPPPPPPKAPQRTFRTANSFTLKNNNTAPGQYKLQHQSGSTWTTLATLGPNASFVHAGLAPDSRHCYRFTVLGSPNSPSGCGYTTDGTGFGAWRIQVELQTADVGDAGTNNAVSVSLTENDTNFTWLDYGRDDFERNTTNTYDLNIDPVDLRGDIHQVKLHTYGTDGWCLARMRLLVNGRETYAQSFTGQPGGCLWLDNNDGHQPTLFVSHATLRAHPSWQGFVQPARFSFSPSDLVATLRIQRPELESRVEGLIGHHLHGESAYWGGLHSPRYVEAWPATIADAVHFDLDLKASVDVLPNPDLDVDFDLKFDAQCSADGTRAEVALSVANLESDADFVWWGELLAAAFSCATGQPDCIDYAENTIEERLENAFGSIALPAGSSQLPQGYRCQTANVDIASDGTVRLIFQLAPAPPISTIPINPVITH